MAGPLFTGSKTPIVMRLLVLAVCVYSTACQPCAGLLCGNLCLSQDYVCDGFPHCTDGSAADERNCPTQTQCSLNFEKCPTLASGTNNVCIHPKWRCDGDNDCGDMSDEDPTFCENTPCPPSMIKCADSFQCLAGYAYCNGVDNCMDGSDEPATCLDPDYTCPPEHFKCVTTGQCIPDIWICDTEDDCGDNSDESEELHTCSNHTCDSNIYFTCVQNRPGHTRCIPLDLLCDGISHCEFAEDEETAMCGTPEPCDSFYQFTCDNNLCIPAWFQCDHDNDCGDGSDEGASCNYRTCTSNEFTCHNGRCISIGNRCDGFDHCRDNSDEEDCTCPDDPNIDYYQCLNKRCIDLSLVCNGNADCTDRTDESDSCGMNECSNSALCEHTCLDTPLSYICMCPGGYILGEDQHTCDDLNECVATPWVCDQVCINTLGSYSCSCAAGYYMSSDGYNCTVLQGGDPHLIFTNRYYIRWMNIGVGSYEKRIAQDFDLVVALDYDYTGGKIYFSDVQARTIMRMDVDLVNGARLNDPDVIHSHYIFNVEGLAVDWITKKLYWTDKVTDVLEVSELDGSKRKALLSSGLFEPRGMALDPKHGYVYFCDWGLRPYIGRIGMDGTDKMELHDDRVTWPNSLTIDYPSGVVYWVDAHLDYVAYSDLNFQQIHQLLHDGNRHTVAHPFAITVFDKTVYFTDWNLKKIFKAPKYGGEEVELNNTIHRPFDIKAVHPLRQPSMSNVCETAAAMMCPGLCLIGAGGQSHTCVCAENFDLSASNVCVPRCPAGQDPCPGEDKCILWYMRCNGVQDCRTGSDELGCPARSCEPGQFQCNDGSCVNSILWLCDGDMDCPDGSDEGTAAQCDSTACLASQFKCTDSGRCISRRNVCNQRNDCDNGSDEADALCATHECLEGYFSCDNGYCIPEEWKCDLDNDCGDNSDEPHRECQDTPCPHGWIRCQSNYRCIPEYARCNTYDECRDNSDEVGCEEITCDPLGEYRCSNHRCIPQRWYCDLDDDCGDFSDEPQGCVPRSCSESEFRCVSRGLCIRDRWRCDGNPDCSDGSDEEGCGPIVCRPDQFQCTSGNCIAANLTCNGYRDCGDRSDEINCVCSGDQFRCDNTFCVPKIHICDTYDDCGDNSDESYSACNEVVCEPDVIMCNVGGLLKCLPEHKRCDGIQDCASNEDELDCETVCTANTFKCDNGQCITWDKVCNLFQDCRDNSDETACHKDTVECMMSTCQKDCIALSNNTVVCSCGKGYASTETGCEDINECNLYNPCAQVCTNTKGSYRCSCAVGFTDRGGQGNNCKANGALEQIVFGDGSELRKYDVAQNRYEDLIVNEVRIDSVDFHFGSEQVYFTDSQLRAVKSVPIDNHGSMEASDNLGLDNVYAPVGIAVDWLGNNIYLTDQGLSPDATSRKRRATADTDPKVVVAALRSHPYHEKTLHRPTKPYAIAVNPRKGLMYWTDLGVPEIGPRLFMSWMNGENFSPVQAAARKLDQPTGLAIDYSANDTVYWCDSRSNKIGFITYDGSHFAILQTSAELSNPFQLDVFGKLIYWTTSNSSEKGMIKTMNKTGGEIAPYLSGINLPTAIKVYQEQRYPQDVPNPCARNPCRYLCLIVPKLKGSDKNFECACPSGVPVDPNHCNVPVTTPLPCRCQNGGKCLVDGTCQCSNGYTGENCAESQTGGGDTPVALVGGLVAFIFLAIIIIVILLLVFLKKRRKFNGPVAYRDGQNVDIHPPPPGRDIEPANHYENTLTPQAPVVLENPVYAGATGAEGGAAYPEKSALPYDPALYQPGYQAGPLPNKADPSAMGMPAHFPEPPPAYSPNNPQPTPPEDKKPE